MQSDNKRIAKNTMVLYLRMLLLMVISLYTSRVNLTALGVYDYGIYNVVGGVVAMFSILSGSLSAAISRFLTFELGRGDSIKLKTIFSSSVTIQIGLSVVILLLAETVGLWFLNSKMVISEPRMYAANWVYQLSLLTFVINLISVPYNAAIIAHERMSAFAYISIFDAAGKLLIAFLISRSPFDRLIFFAILLAVLSMISRIIYGWYCKKNFEECSYRFIYDHRLFVQMFSFAGWNFIGASSAILRDQGGNILINIFCGPAVNAARGISFQVNHAVNGFVQNFMTALNPQITKSFANNDRVRMLTLIYQGARLSYYMLFILSLPVLVSTPYILNLWLGTVPDHTVWFVRLVLLFGMSESISGPLVTAMLATGNIRNYQLVVGGLQMLNLPISWVLLSYGFSPECVFIVAIVVSQFCLITRLYMLKSMIGLSTRTFVKKVYLNVAIVTVVSAIFPFFISSHLSESFVNFLILTFLSIIAALVTEFYLGCNKTERNFVKEKVKFYASKYVKDR